MNNKETANLKCPYCGYIMKVEILDKKCLAFHKCEKCSKIIKTPEGECCVICAYSDKKCPAKVDKLFNYNNYKEMSDKNNCNYWQCANRIGLFLVFLFVICFIWYWLRPVEQEFHLRSLRLLFFGFNGMNFVSFILGAVQGYIWGYIAVGLWRLAGCCRKKDNK